MIWPDFEVRVPGKWVLTGEHAVLRGEPAVALPYLDASLRFEYSAMKKDEAGEPYPSFLHDLIRLVSERCQKAHLPFSSPSGQIRVESSIPIGAGLGSSAAICVAMT